MKSIKALTVLMALMLLCICACSKSIQEELKFPDSLNALENVSTTTNIPTDSSFINMAPNGLICNKWIKGSGSRCGLVKDCENYTYEEAKRIGDHLAKSINESTKAICKDLNCPKRQFRKVKWTNKSCDRSMLCIGISYEFRCIDS